MGSQSVGLYNALCLLMGVIYVHHMAQDASCHIHGAGILRYMYGNSISSRWGEAPEPDVNCLKLARSARCSCGEMCTHQRTCAVQGPRCTLMAHVPLDMITHART